MIRSVFLFVVLLGSARLGLAQAPALPTKDDPERFGVIEIDPVRVKYVSSDAWVEDEKIGNEIKKKVVFQIRDPNSKTTAVGVLKNKQLNPDRIAETVDAVATAYHTELVTNLKVSPGQIWIVVSCHFSDLPEDQKTELRDRVLKSVRQRVPNGWQKAEWEKVPIPFKILSPKEEFTYICYGLKDRSEGLGDCVVSHVGSGPTHSCYFEDNGGKINFRGIGYVSPFSGGMGFARDLHNKMIETKVVTKDADHRPKFPDALKNEVRELKAQLENSAAGVNGLTGRKTHYITGDLAEALLILVKPEALLDTADQIPVTAKEIDALVNVILNNRNPDGSFLLPRAKYPEAAPSDVMKKLDNFYNDIIRDSMSAEELASAAVVLQALSKQLQYEDKTKTLIILKDTRHAWSSGYLKRHAEENLEKLIKKQK
ncbi:MAG: hypothetical protein K8U57_20225 [Planctomycetes bacterium]|nr:hypothetical protein [Planctomycetota bacterium]